MPKYSSWPAENSSSQLNCTCSEKASSLIGKTSQLVLLSSILLAIHFLNDLYPNSFIASPAAYFSAVFPIRFLNA